jgi:hypothetical protein
VDLVGAAQCVHRSFRSALEMKFHQDVADMVTGRLNADEQPLGYLTVGEAFTEEIENLKLSLRETRISLRPRPTAAVEGS